MSTLVAPSQHPAFHLVRGVDPAIFMTRGSMLFDIDTDLLEALERDDPQALEELRALDIVRPPSVPAGLPVAALSLNVAQSCNLACTYCYADEGRFGGSPRVMSEKTAFAAIDRLVEQGRGRVTVGFIGGEPFLNRDLIHIAVVYAKAAAQARDLRVGFSVTTNATLLTEADIDLLRSEAFTVTVSLDGGREQNRHRADRGGQSSLDTVIARIDPLLKAPGRAKIAARATLTRDDLDVAKRVETLASLGFAEVGVSPARTGPCDELLLVESDWSVLLAEMTSAALQEVARTQLGLGPRFGNLWSALRAIHRGAARALPCGSGATYLSVDVDGVFASCHRTVGDQAFAMGTVEDGFDQARREAFVSERAVDQIPECNICWARYLCGGGCHAEVAAVGRAGCDYIRGWLDLCLRLYRNVAASRPDLLDGV